MTREQKIAFIDKTVELMAAQGKRAVVGYGAHELCVYRAHDGTACAIGIHAPPEVGLYLPEGRVSTIAGLAKNGAPTGCKLFEYIDGADYNNPEDVYFLGSVQRCHDAAADIAGVLERLAALRTEVAGLPLPG